MPSESQRIRIHHGRRFDFELVRQRQEDGSVLEREVVRHPGAVVVLAVTDDRRIVLIRNYRLALESWVWELPAGTMEPPEPADCCASRELEEEAGFRAGLVEPIGEFYTTPGMTDELMHAFLATDLSSVPRRLEADERIDVQLMPIEHIQEMILDGTLRDAKSSLAILLASQKGMLALASPFR